MDRRGFLRGRRTYRPFEQLPSVFRFLPRTIRGIAWCAVHCVKTRVPLESEKYIGNLRLMNLMRKMGERR